MALREHVSGMAPFRPERNHMAHSGLAARRDDSTEQREGVKDERRPLLRVMPRLLDPEELDMMFGPGGLGPLDSDDIDALIAAGAWRPEGSR
jgi:hypothetical protein